MSAPPHMAGPTRPRDPATIGKIVQTPDVVAGDPRIEGTRIQTWVIWDCHQEGVSTDEMLAMFPRLTPEDIRAALEFEAARRRQSA
jgi:uncharacterized protein (DUF433 family)